MKKQLSQLFFLLTLFNIFFTSCKKEAVNPAPTADFVYSGNGNAPSLVSFVNTSQNADTYLWDFGDNSTSTEKDPKHTYTNAGVYTVRLKATGKGGDASVTKTVNIQAPIGSVADFTFNAANLRAPVSIPISNASQNATSYSWDFGNGQTSTQVNPSVTYTTGGTFTITLTAYGQNGTQNRISKTVTILPPYTRVGISSLSILNYPSVASTGANWDPAINGTFPDVYFVFTPTGTTTNLYALPVSSRAENLRIADLPHTWTSTPLGTSFYLHNDLNQIIDVDLYDYDSVSSNEYMGTATFNFRNYVTVNNPYPSSVTITNGQVSIRLGLIWQ